jgi:branched-chain amino acid transport system substrate-binding protein
MKRILCIVLIVAMSILVTACGSSPQSADENKPIVIGASLSLTGNLARNGQDQQRGYEMWRDDVNKRGGILGRQVELKVYDDGSDPQTGVKLYEKLITDDKVDLLIGPYGSSVTMTASTVGEKYKMVMIAPGASSKEIWERGYKYCFQMLSPAREQLRPALQLAKEKGYTKIAIVSADSAFPKDLAHGALIAAEDFGLEVVLQEEYPEKTTDLSALVAKIKKADPDVLIIGSYLPDGIMLVKQMKEANVAPKMIQFGPNGPSLPDFVTSLGADAEYILGVSQWEPNEGFPGAKEFTEAYIAKYNEKPTYSVAGAYAAGQILEQAIAEVGSLDQEKIREYLATADLTTTFGKFRVDETGAQVGHETMLIQILNGERVVVYPLETAQQEMILPFPGWKR